MTFPTFRNLRIRLRESLWFVPGAILLGSVALAFVLLTLDRMFGAVLVFSADGARAMLATIAGSLMTVAGVTFSITVVTLSLAANQYSPRVLRNFSRDRSNQVTLGFFVGVFAYCMVVLGAVHGNNSEFVPSLSVLGAQVLAISTVGVLIYFIHHTAASIEGSHIVSTVAQETAAHAEELFPEAGSACPRPASKALPPEWNWFAVPSTRTGYIQAVDIEGLVKYAQSQAIIIRIKLRVGEFLASGETLAEVWSENVIETEPHTAVINRHIEIGHFRTLTQDLAFGIRQTVDVSLKALSPGINDTGTAIMCVDYLSAILLVIAPRQDPPCEYYEAETLCLVTREVTFSYLLAEAFDSIRRNADDNSEVLATMIRALARIASATHDPARRAAILDQARYIRDAANRGVTSGRDLGRVLELASRLAGTLGDK